MSDSYKIGQNAPKFGVFEPNHQVCELFTGKWVFRLSIGSIVDMLLGYEVCEVIGCRELGGAKSGFFSLAFVSKKQKLERMISPLKMIFFPNPLMGSSAGS